MRNNSRKNSSRRSTFFNKLGRTNHERSNHLAYSFEFPFNACITLVHPSIGEITVSILIKIKREVGRLQGRLNDGSNGTLASKI